MNDVENEESPPAKTGISRRKLLASLGMAGVVLASEGVLGGTGWIPAARAATVTTYAVRDIANLRTIPTGGLAADQLAFVAGYYSGSDEGGGLFYWDASATAADNGGTVIVPNGYGGAGRWKRIISP